ncbi:hypothetical protein FF1_012329 [Malus domestica]
MGVQFFHEKEADFDGGLFGLRFHLHGLGCAKAKFCCGVLNAFGLGCDSETKRVKVVKHDGWPSWVDDLTIYFYRRDEDQWSVYMAILLREGPGSTKSMVVQRVTPPGLHTTSEEKMQNMDSL